MKKTHIPFICLILLIGCTNTKREEEIAISQKQTFIQPKAVAEKYFDTIICDDFRQLENLNDTNVLNWFRYQGKYADSVLSTIPGREGLIELMDKYNHRKLEHITKIRTTKNDRYFYLKRKSDEELFKLYYRKNRAAKEEMLLNPLDLKLNNNTDLVIYDYSPDWEGDKIAIALASQGSDKMQIVLYDLSSKSILPQVLENNFNASEQTVTWLPNNKGFLYLAYNNDTALNSNALLDMKTMYYKIGEDASSLVDVFSKASCPELDIKPEDFPDVLLNHQNSKYLIGIVSGPNTFNDAYYTSVENVSNGNLHWKPLYKKEHEVVRGTFVGDDFIFISAHNASNHNISRVNLNNADFNSPEILIPEKTDEVIQNFKITSSGLYYTTSKNGVEAKLYSYINNEDKNMKLPGKFGRISIDSKSPSSPDLWVSVSGWINDLQRMKYNPITNSFTKEQLASDAKYPEFEKFDVEELNIQSHDGEMVPLSLISKKGIKKDGNNPTLLYGYGAYGISWRPYFMPDWLTWVENGGILCFSHIRGGGEKGNLWHTQGKNHNKANSWKDFIACAEFLIDQKYTSNKKLVIYGGSAGGIVIGRSMTERPDLFAAIISEVGMLNAVRIANMPSGLNHAKEFGSITDSADCKDLIEMDAYLHIDKDAKYPPFLAVVGMNDLRVSPWQSGKFIAKMQQNTSGDNLSLMMVDFDEGHYFNSTKTKSMEKLASIFAFAFWQTDCSEFQGKSPKK